MSIRVRPAKVDDIEAIVPFIKMASGGISEFLLTDAVQGVSVDELIEMALTDENTTYHYQNVLVAEYQDQIIAASNYYPAEQHCLPDIMRSFLSKEKLDIIKPYTESRVNFSMYIHTLAVSHDYRHTGCGLILGKKIEQIARTQQKQCLSAHVWCDNTVIYDGLKMAGFKVVEHIPIKEHPDLLHQGGIVLLKGPNL